MKTTLFWKKRGFFHICVLFLLSMCILTAYYGHYGDTTGYQNLFGIRNMFNQSESPIKYITHEANFFKQNITQLLVETRPMLPNAKAILGKKVEKCSYTVVIILCEDKTDNKKIQHNDVSRQMQQAMVLLKSIAILTKFPTGKNDTDPDHDAVLSPNCISVIIFTDQKTLFDEIVSKIRSEWSPEFQRTLNLSYFPVSYPKGSEWMRDMFRPCATLRLFIPELLPRDIGSVLYVDTDFIFLESIQSLFETYWEREGHDDYKVIAAMSPCLWIYGSKNNKVPYYGSSGLNAGLMMMNVTKMEEKLWGNEIRNITSKYKKKINYADQDILNIYFHFHPEELILLPCYWNFRSPNCDKSTLCKDLNITEGISAIHGTSATFTSTGTKRSEPLFYEVFQAFHQLKLDSEFKLETLVKQLKIRLINAEKKVQSKCKTYGQFSSMVLNRLSKLMGVVE